MKIVHISIYPPRGEKHAKEGGVASYTKNLINSTPYAKGDEIYVLCNKLGKERTHYKEDNISVIRCFDRNIKFIFQLLQELWVLNPDVIHFQQELGLYGGVITAYMLQWLLFFLRGKKIYITIHGVVSLKRVNREFVTRHRSSMPVWLVRLAFFVIYKPLCVWSSYVIVHEEYFRNVLVDEYGAKEDKIQVIHHGVEEMKTEQKEKACVSLRIDVKRDIVLFMGYLTGYKDIDLLIEGFSRYNVKNKNAYLIIGAGKHPRHLHDESYLSEYRRLKEKAKKTLDSSSYRWVGFIPEESITKYYCASDVSVYPYTVCMSSSGPMAIAMGCNKPFLASHYFEDLLPERKILFDNTIESFAAKLNDFFANKKEYQAKCTKMRAERVWNKIGARTYEAYQLKL